MIGTLELVARTGWVTVLPSLISVNDIDGSDLAVNPIDPPMHAEFVVIQPARRTLSTQARLFLDRFQAEVAQIQARWEQALSAPSVRDGARSRGRHAREGGHPVTTAPSVITGSPPARGRQRC
jgi:hypothetical protein